MHKMKKKIVHVGSFAMIHLWYYFLGLLCPSRTQPAELFKLLTMFQAEIDPKRVLAALFLKYLSSLRGEEDGTQKSLIKISRSRCRFILYRALDLLKVGEACDYPKQNILAWICSSSPCSRREGTLFFRSTSFFTLF